MVAGLLQKLIQEYQYIYPAEERLACKMSNVITVFPTATRAASCLETAYVVKDRIEVAGQQQDGEFLLLVKRVEGKKA